MKISIGPYVDEGERDINIHLDNYDTWSMDHTLAMIIVPMLKQLKETKHGAPHVDLEDVPTELWPSEAEQLDYNRNGHTDEKFFERWDWVMDEMIWAFEQIVEDDDSQFYSGESDRIVVPVDKDGNEVPEEGAEFFEWRKGPNDTFEVDMEGLKAYHDRIKRGTTLFGKYFQNLWD